jgi:hypothetical protein
MGSLRNNKYYSGFDPRNIPGCQLWLDAADSNTLTLSGTNVTAWRDKSGNRNNASAPTTNYPAYQAGTLNGQGTVGFNASSDALIVSNNFAASTYPSLCYIIVIRPSAAAQPNTTYAGILSTDNPGLYGRTLGFGAGNWQEEYFSGFTNITPFTPGAWAIVSLQFNSTVSATLTVNGTSYAGTASGTGSANTNGLKIGAYNSDTNYATYNGNFDTGEILIYGANLSTSQRQQIEGYLAWKWGLIPRFQDPTSIPGSILWLDGADTSTLTSGGATWTDKSGTGNHAINGTPGASSMPTTTTWTNGLQVARFTATSKNSIKTTNLIPNLNITFFIVFRSHTFVAGVSRIMINNVDGHRQVYISGNTAFPVSVTSWANYNSPQTTISSLGQNTPVIFVGTIASGGYNTYVNGSSVAGTSTATSSASRNYFGSGDGDGSYASIDIAEIVIYDTVLSTVQRQQVEGYLADKWGLRGNLPGTFPTLFPASHPFYRSLPYTRAFNPLDVSGCTLWLDGADGGSMTLSGSNITQWRDKSGLGSDATASGTPVFVQNALASNSVVSFNGSSYFTGSQSDTNNTHSILAVVRFNSGGPQYARLLSFGVNGQFDYNNAGYYNLSSNTVQFAITRNGTETDVAGLTSDAYHIVTAIFNGTTGLYYVDGGMTSNSAVWTSNFNFNQYRIGADQIPTTAQQLQGNVGEIITYSNALSTTERLQLERYLGWKWNISNQISQPTDIPGCALWLDASDPNALVLSGSTVTQWRDKSGIGNHTTSTSGTSTYTSNAINGVPAILMSSSYFTGGFASTYTGTSIRAFVVATMNTSGQVYGRILSVGRPGASDYADPTSLLPLTRNGGQNIGIWRNGTNTNANVPTYDVPFLARSASEGSTISIAINGGTDSSVGSGTSSGFNITTYCVGANVQGPTVELYGGYIGEIIYYTSALTTAQVQQVEKYLARKWGIVASIPSSTLSMDIPPSTTVLEPPQLSDLAIWLDAADNSRVSLSGSNVSAWIDKSSNGLSMTGATPPTYVSNVLNGRQVVSFTTAQSLSSTTALTLSPSNTWALVFNSPTGGNFFMVEHSSNINNVQGSYFLGVNWDLYAMNRTGVLSTWKRYQDTIGQNVPPFSANTWYIAIVSDNNLNGGVFFRRNGTTRSIVNVNSYTSLAGNITSNFFINHRVPANVNFGEILVYNRGLTLSEVQSLEGYLANKWGLRSSLPSTHPYVKETP